VVLARVASSRKETTVQDFRKLLVWQKSHHLALKVHVVSEALNRQRQYSLSDQLARSSRSIAANLAEGCGRTGDRDFRRFVRIALGSASELEYHLLLARDLALLPEPEYAHLAGLASEVKRMLSGLATTLNSDVKLKADG